MTRSIYICVCVYMVYNVCNFGLVLVHNFNYLFVVWYF